MSAGGRTCIPTSSHHAGGTDSVRVSDPPMTMKDSDYFGSGYEPDLEDEGHLGRPTERKVVRKKVHCPFHETPVKSILKESEGTLGHSVRRQGMRVEVALEKRVPLKQVPEDEDEVFQKDHVLGGSSSASHRIEQLDCKQSTRGPAAVERALMTTRKPSRAGCEKALNKVIFYIGSTCSSDGYESMKENKDSAIGYRERKKRGGFGKAPMNQSASSRKSSLEVDPFRPSGPTLANTAMRFSGARGGHQDKPVYRRQQQEIDQPKTFSQVVYKPRPPPIKSSCRCS